MNKFLLHLSMVVVAMAGVAAAAEFDFKAITAEPAQGEVNKAKAKSAKSDTALPYLKLDIERQPVRPGWVLAAKLGAEWVVAKGAGMTFIGDNRVTTNRITEYDTFTDFNKTDAGIGGEIGVGWNFGPRIPLTLGLNFGFGPASELESIVSNYGGTGPNGSYDLYSYQKLSIYTFDFSFDYNFRNCSKWTPFVGAIVGAAVISDKGHTVLNPSEGNNDPGRLHGYGSYGTERRINFMAGARAGVKYDLNECVQFSLFGSYSYLGKAPGREYEIQAYDAAGGFVANPASMGLVKTNKADLHSFAIKAGIRVMF